MRKTGRMSRLLLWFQQRCGFLRAGTMLRGSSETVTTVETIESEERTILIGLQQVSHADVCPLCGSRLSAKGKDRVQRQLGE
jgi:DNA-directed RNA polymerase subunit RPC12/RpoP